MRIDRRAFLQLSAGTAIASAVYSCTQRIQQPTEVDTKTELLAPAQTTIKLTIGYLPIAAGLPLYLALEKGFFKESSLNVKAEKFISPQQFTEALIAARVDGCAEAMSSVNLILGETASPGLFKIFGANASNVKNVLDVFVVAKNSPIEKISELQGKEIACGPGIQQTSTVKGILAKNGVTDYKIKELPWSQHIPIIEAGQADAAYTLEPSGTIGSLSGITRIIETGVFSKYLLGNPLAPRFGGMAVISTKFLKENSEATKKFISDYRRGVESIRKSPGESRHFLDKYTPIDARVANAVPLTESRLYNEFSASDMEYFQKFVDFYYENKVLTRKVDIASLVLQDSDLT